MTPWLDDGDVRLYHGDALQVLAGLPDGSVDCVVTSPPYWGLRDYGTGAWDGGDPDCDHMAPEMGGDGKSSGLNAKYKDDGQFADDSHSQRRRQQYRNECGKCGATRQDRQMGLEATPDEFVAGMVTVFREVRRVLADHGTCWVNLGDTYNSRLDGSHGGWNGSSPEPQRVKNDGAIQKPRYAGKPKDLVGIPWRVAFALQTDGWYLRSDIIWAKPNPMPESVTDRPTKSHEYVFLLTKRPRYWFDTEAVREPQPSADPSHPAYRPAVMRPNGSPNYAAHGELAREHNAGGPATGIKRKVLHPAGRNVRSVWNIATQPYPEAHFATFPEELARRCILAGCPTRVCRVCGKPSERIVEREPTQPGVTGGATPYDGGRPDGMTLRAGGFGKGSSETVGWSDCGHCCNLDCNCPTADAQSCSRRSNWRPGTVLDPFIGSGTVAKVARDHQRHAIGIDLSEQYLELAARRLQQLSLLSPTIGE